MLDFHHVTPFPTTDGVAMGSLLGPTLANTFLCFYDRKLLEKCSVDFKPVFYRIYVNDIFDLFKSINHLGNFCNYLNTCHQNMYFSFEKEKNVLFRCRNFIRKR